MSESSSRSFEPLPIDNTAGFPQSFSHLFAGSTYHFFVYANLPAEELADETVEFFDLPSASAHLGVRVERDVGDGERRTLLARKVVPGITYEVEEIALEFPEQRLARSNINGRGDAGSRVVGRIARRWA